LSDKKLFFVSTGGISSTLSESSVPVKYLSILLKKKSETHDFTFHEDDTYETIWNAAGLSGVPVGPEQAKIWNTYGREYPIWATRNGQVDFTNCEI
jgi:hypothetical protein